MNNEIRCNRCIMDNISDNKILFDINGYCNYCSTAIKNKNNIYFPNKIGEEKIYKLIKLLKEKNKNKKYDCLMGISGGLDSSYLAYLGYKWGLRIICVHIDDGFDTDISKENINKLKKATGFDFITIEPDKEQFNNLTKAFMKASVPNIAMPQDNILFAVLYDYAKKNKIKYFLSGSNFALECILQEGNTHSAYDLKNIKDINNKYGDDKLDKLKFVTAIKRLTWEILLGIKTITPLNYINYSREIALKELNEFCGFEYYGRKHLENILTAFNQLYWLPKKFNVDKRTSHLSSMIISGQMTRDEALNLYLNDSICDEKLLNEYIEIIKSKLNITENEFIEIMNNKTKQHTDFKTDKIINFVNLYKSIKRIFSK